MATSSSGTSICGYDARVVGILEKKERTGLKFRAHNGEVVDFTEAVTA